MDTDIDIYPIISQRVTQLYEMGEKRKGEGSLSESYVNFQVLAQFSGFPHTSTWNDKMGGYHQLTELLGFLSENPHVSRFLTADFGSLSQGP